MSKRVLFVVLLIVRLAVGQAKPSHKFSSNTETAHLDFVKEFVRELNEDEDLKITVQKEVDEDKTPDQRFSTSIYYSKACQIQLRQRIAMLKGMHLKAPFDFLIRALQPSVNAKLSCMDS